MSVCAGLTAPATKATCAVPPTAEPPIVPETVRRGKGRPTREFATRAHNLAHRPVHTPPPFALYSECCAGPTLQSPR